MQPTSESSTQHFDEIGDPTSWEPSLAFLKYIIAALLLGAAAYLATLFVVAPDQPTRAVGPVAVSLVGVTGWFYSSLGRVRAAVNVLAIGSWITVTGIAFIHGGVRTPIIFAYPLIILLTGWLIGSRTALALTAVTVATTVIFVRLESSGLLPTPPSTPAALLGAVQIVIFVLSAILSVLLVRSYQNRLRELAQRTTELRKTTTDLQRAQAVASIGSWEYDLSSDTMRLSGETCRIFGLPEGTQGSYGSYLARTHPDDRRTAEQAWQAALGNGAFDHEHRILLGDSVRWVRQKAEITFATDGSAQSATGIAQDITQRRQSEDALQETRRLLDEVQKLSHLGGWKYDVATQQMTWTEEVYRIHGVGADYDTNDIENSICFYAPEDRQTISRAFTKALNDAEPYDLELRFVRSDGSRQWVHTSGIPKVENGRVISVTGNISDITERRHAAEMLRKSEQHFRAFFERSMVGMAETSPQKGWVEVNQRLCEILGLSREELTRMTWTELTHPDDLAADEAQFNRVLAGEIDEYAVEKRFIHHDGHVIYAHTAARCIRREDRTIDYFVALVDDISDRKRAEIALRESERRLRATLDSALDAVISIDAAGRLIDFNPAAEAIFGWKKEEVLGRSMAAILIPEDYRTAHQCGLERFMTTRTSHIINHRMEMTALRRDGSVIPVELAITAIRQLDQDIFTAYLRDITQRKRMEEQVRQLAFYDTLTELPNRRLLHDRLSQAMAASTRSACHGAVIFLDLDNFKPLNDTYGHSQGDLLLIEVANRLRKCVREIDTVARIGGDEFVVILSELNLEKEESLLQATIIAEKIRNALAEPYHLTLCDAAAAGGTIEHRCTASIGATLFRNHQTAQDDILRCADTAMYQAKTAGRNSIRFIDSDVSPR